MLSRMQLTLLCGLLVVSESALLEVESSTELVAGLPFVRFALPELHDKQSASRGHESFLQQAEVKVPVAKAAGTPAVPVALPAVPAATVPAESSGEVPAAKLMAPMAPMAPMATAVAPRVAQQMVAQANVAAQAAAVPGVQTVSVQPAAVPQPPAPAMPQPVAAAVAPVAAAVSATAAPSGAKQVAPQVGLVSHGEKTATKKMSPATQVAATFSLALIVKVLCMLSNVACHVSPFPQVQQFHKLGDTGEADSAPLMSILYSGSQWVFYGNFAYCMTGKSGFLVLVYANITGAVLGVYYVWGFQKNCRDQKALQQLHLYCRAAAFVFSMQFLAIWSLSFSSALFFSGLMASLSSIIGACSLCSTLPKVIKTQCSASINLELLIVGICSSVLWVSCGVMLWDVWILLPTLFGLVIQLACGFFVLLFPREEHGDLIHLPSRSPICCWVLPTDCDRLENSTSAPGRPAALAGRAAAAAAQIRAALRASERAQDYGSTAVDSPAAGAGTGGTC